jgi:hypothetical protein
MQVGWRNPAGNALGATPENPVMFYTSFPKEVTPTQALVFGRLWIKKVVMKNSASLTDVTDGEWRIEQGQWLLDNPQMWLNSDYDLSVDIEAKCWVQALGTACQTPSAYLMTPDNVPDWDLESWWAQIEYPALTQNPNVQAIYRVDPRPTCEKFNAPTKIWARPADSAVSMAWSCPWTTHSRPTAMASYPPWRTTSTPAATRTAN